MQITQRYSSSNHELEKEVDFKTAIYYQRLLNIDICEFFKGK